MEDYREEFNNLWILVGLSESSKQLTTKHLGGLLTFVCDELGGRRITMLEEAYINAHRGAREEVKSAKINGDKRVRCH